jgi:hypothetical protein
MPDWAGSTALRLVIATVITLSMFLSSIGSFSSHQPAAFAGTEANRHAELAAKLDRSAAHEEGRSNQQGSGHSLDHSLTDHTHETPSTPPGAMPIIPGFVRAWQALPPSLVQLETSFRLDRPPRPILGS